MPSLRNPTLTTLRLDNNRLRRLPADVGVLANLSRMTLAHNEIEARGHAMSSTSPGCVSSSEEP